MDPSRSGGSQERPLHDNSTDYNIFKIKNRLTVLVDVMDDPWISSISVRIYPSSMVVPSVGKTELKSE